MKKMFFILVFFIPFIIFTYPNESRSIKYNISFVEKGGNCFFKVNLKFKGDSSGKTTIRIPNSWAWQKTYLKGIKNILFENKNITVNPNQEKTKYIINHSPGQILNISYQVFQYWKQKINRDVYYRPIINQTYFHFIGHGFFVVPEFKKNIKHKISLQWNGLKNNWQIINSFGVKSQKQKLKISIEELCHATYMAGDFKLTKLDIKNSPVYIAQRGKWKFKIQDFKDMVKSVVIAVRGFWNDYSFPYFLVTLIPIESESSKGGTGLTNSFETFVSTDCKSVNNLKFLLTHELFHTWNGRKINRLEPEELVYWFSEGFTNYYTRLILLQNQLITLEDYIADYNKTIKDYYFSPAIHSTNQEILKLTHDNRDIEKIPYLRGDLLAVRWNAQIKKSTKSSLDNVMFDILSSALKLNMLISAENFNLHIKKYLKAGIMDDIDKFINQGRVIVPGPDDLGPDVELKEVKLNRFSLGFKSKKIEKGYLVTNVATDGPAYNKGLRENDTVIGRSIYWGRVDKEVSITFLDQSRKKKTIKYLPLGETINVPQYQLKESSKNKVNCISWFKNK